MNQPTPMKPEKPEKPNLSLSFIRQMSEVRQFGIAKYAAAGQPSWPDITAEEHCQAAIRHIAATSKEDLDQESNLPHLAHAAVRLMFAQDIIQQVAAEHRAKSILSDASGLSDAIKKLGGEGHGFN